MRTNLSSCSGCVFISPFVSISSYLIFISYFLTLSFSFPQVKSIRRAAKGKSETAGQLQEQTAAARSQLERQRAKATEMEEALQQRHAQSQRVSADLVQKVAARNDLAEERKERWRVLESLQVIFLLRFRFFLFFFGVVVRCFWGGLCWRLEVEPRPAHLSTRPTFLPLGPLGEARSIDLELCFLRVLLLYGACSTETTTAAGWV